MNPYDLLVPFPIPDHRIELDLHLDILLHHLDTRQGRRGGSDPNEPNTSPLTSITASKSASSRKNTLILIASLNDPPSFSSATDMILNTSRAWSAAAGPACGAVVPETAMVEPIRTDLVYP